MGMAAAEYGGHRHCWGIQFSLQYAQVAADAAFTFRLYIVDFQHIT
jgi:hypothetical protein